MIDNFNKTKYVALTLENTDQIILNLKDIQQLDFSNITFSNEYFNDGFTNNFISLKVAQEIKIVLKQSANQIHNEFGFKGSSFTVFERLTKHHDIVYICFLDASYKEFDRIYVEYVDKEPGKLGTDNINQHTKIIKELYYDSKSEKSKEEEQLVITINKSKKRS